MYQHGVQVGTKHLEAGASTLHTAKQDGCYLQLLASPRACCYYAALLRMRLAVALLGASAGHYLAAGPGRAAILEWASRATEAWEQHGSALRAACYKAAAAMEGQEAQATEAQATEAQAMAVMAALEAEAPEACWKEGRCALSLLPVGDCGGLATCPWGARVSLVMLANLYQHVDGLLML